MFLLFDRTREEEGWDDNSYTNDANPFGDPNLTATFRYALMLIQVFYEYYLPSNAFHGINLIKLVDAYLLF
jgi:hypothetical protein